jgi:mannose-6-phosphate isomerase-like protein (cupin superfamily)
MMITRPETVIKLWGCETQIVTTDKYTGKVLNINPGFISSIHMHAEKKETFYVESGVVRLAVYDKQFVDGPIIGQPEEALVVDQTYDMQPGDTFTREPNTYHSFTALYPTRVYGFSTPHSDDDVYRITESRSL